MKRLLTLILLSVSATFAYAQLGVYAMGSAGRLSGYPLTSFTGVTTVTQTNNNLWAYGGTFGLYDNFLRLGPFKLGADLRGFTQTSSTSNSGISNKLRGGLGGLRLAGSAPLVPFKPYIQAEIGAANTNFGTSTTNTTGFVYQVQLGADFTVFPHLDVRAEYGVGQFIDVVGLGATSTHYTLQQLGAGAVLRF